MGPQLLARILRIGPSGLLIRFVQAVKYGPPACIRVGAQTHGLCNLLRKSGNLHKSGLLCSHVLGIIGIS